MWPGAALPERAPGPAGHSKPSRIGLLFRILLFAAAALPSSAPLAAQRILSVDLSGAQVRYADTLSTSLFAVTPSLQLTSSRAELSGSATLSQLRTGGWSAQGALAGSWFTRRRGALMGDLGATAGGSAHRDGTHTGQALASARAHLIGTRTGGWFGLAAGGSWSGDDWHLVRQAEIAGWARSANSSAVLALSPTVVTDSIQFVDAVLALDWKRRAVELGALAGYRAGDRSPVLGGTNKVWGSASLAFWLTERTALVAAGGTYPVDLTQGFPGGRFFTVALRMRTPRRPADPPPDSVSAPAAALPLSFEVIADSGHTRTLRVHAPGAHSVEVTGDFTNWQALPFQSGTNGWWTVTVQIAPGTYQLNLRVDGGPLLVPPGLAAVTDEFGGKVGILQVTR